MALQTNEYQCPACSGPLHFDPKCGKLKCEYCGSEYETAQIEAMFAQKEKAAQQASKDAQNAPASEDDFSDWGVDLKAFVCESCGAELVCDDNTAATCCPYCGNPTVIPGRFADMEKPDYIIPFKIEKKQAVDALKKHYQGKTLLPSAFTNANHIDKIQGVYVPFWMYDGASYGKITYEAKKIKTYRDGDEEVTETELFYVERSGKMEFEKVPADASSEMKDDLMDSIEPYDYKDLKPFSSAYLPGYLADKYDVSKEECAKRVLPRMKNSFVSAMRNTVEGYDNVTEKEQNVKTEHQKTSYAMMPVWLLSTKWDGKSYTFAVNGQTGKLVGDLPLDKTKMLMWFLGLGAGLSLVLSLFFAYVLETTFIPGIVIGLIIAAIVVFIMKGSLRSVATASYAGNYSNKEGLELSGKIDRFVRKTEERRKIEQNNN